MSRNPYDPPKAEVGLQAPVAQQGETFTKVTVVYTARFFDLWRFTALQQLRSIPVQIFYAGLAAALALMSVRNDEHCDMSGACVAVGVILALIVYLSMFVLQLGLNAVFLYSRNNRSAFTEHRVELTRDGVYEETQYKRSLFLWPGIRKVVSGVGMVAVYVTAQAAVAIPKRSFASIEQREFFIRTIQTNITKR